MPSEWVWSALGLLVLANYLMAGWIIANTTVDGERRTRLERAADALLWPALLAVGGWLLIRETVTERYRFHADD